MRVLSIALLLAASSGVLFAGPPSGQAPGETPAYLQEEIEQLFADNAGTALGSVTAAELQTLLGRLSVAAQKAAFVERSRQMSFAMPGLGQFVNEDYGSGALFLAIDLVVVTGTLLGGYALLPEEVRFGQLNYFRDSYDTIRTAWEGQSFVDLLPTMGVLAGGALLKAVVGGISSAHAGRLAVRNIAEGKITFEPQLLPGMFAGPGPWQPQGPWGMHWGMKMRY